MSVQVTVTVTAPDEIALDRALQAVITYGTDWDAKEGSVTVQRESEVTNVDAPTKDEDEPPALAEILLRSDVQVMHVLRPRGKILAVITKPPDTDALLYDTETGLFVGKYETMQDAFLALQAELEEKA